MRIGSDPTDEELASMTATELEAWAEAQAIGPWTPNEAPEAPPATAGLTVRMSSDLVAELEAEAALHRQLAPRYARDLLLLALRQVQAARGALDRAPAGRAADVSQPLPEPAPPSPLTGEALCARYTNRVYRFAAMVARSPQDAEDLAQTALERAIRALPTYDAERGDVEGWLWRIVAGAMRRRLPRWAGPGARRRPAPASGEALLAAVRALPRRQRAAIALRYGADIDLRTAAAALGLPEAAAALLVRRGLARLPGRPAAVERRLRVMEVRPPHDLPARATASAARQPGHGRHPGVAALQAAGLAACVAAALALSR